MKKAVVKNGIVTNIIRMGEGEIGTVDGDLVDVSSGCEVGSAYDSGAFRKPVLEDKTKPRNEAKNRLDALNVTRDELLDAILSGMNYAQFSGQIDWPAPLDGILSAWVAQGKKEEK